MNIGQLWIFLYADLACTLFYIKTLNRLKRAINRWLLPWVMFLPVLRGAGACGVASAICKQLCFPTWAFAAGFNNNINNTFTLNSKKRQWREIFKIIFHITHKTRKSIPIKYFKTFNEWVHEKTQVLVTLCNGCIGISLHCGIASHMTILITNKHFNEMHTQRSTLTVLFLVYLLGTQWKADIPVNSEQCRSRDTNMCSSRKGE